MSSLPWPRLPSFLPSLTPSLPLSISPQHGRKGQPKLKTFVFNPNKAELEWHHEGPRSALRSLLGIGKRETMSSIALADVVEVRRGAQTKVLSKAADMVDPAKTFSLVTRGEYTLDVVMANTQDRDTVLRALKVLFEDAGLAPAFV